MELANSASLLDVLKSVDDPRSNQGKRHELYAMLAAVICATLCGARSLGAVAQWMRSQVPKTWHMFGFKWKPPCENSYRNLLQEIDPGQFEQIIREWTATLEGFELDDDSLQAVSIDGKTLCGTLQAHKQAIHLLAAFDHQTGYVLSQTQVAPETNEAKASLDFLKTLVLGGKVIIGDAMFCQREICEQVIDSGGDYFVVVKENQPRLRKEIELIFADSSAFSPLPTA